MLLKYVTYKTLTNFVHIDVYDYYIVLLCVFLPSAMCVCICCKIVAHVYDFLRFIFNFYYPLPTTPHTSGSRGGAPGAPPPLTGADL